MTSSAGWKSSVQVAIMAFGLCVYPGMAQSQPNQTLSLNGTSAYVTIPSSSNLQPSSAITVEAWIFPVPNASDNPFFLSKSDGQTATSQRTYEITWPNGLLWFNLFLGSSTWAAVAAPVPTNQWTHIAATYASSSGLLQLYTNGVLAESTTHDASDTVSLAGQLVRQTAQPLCFGVCPTVENLGEGDTFAAGYLDEVRIWATNLTGEQIAENRFCRLTGAESNLTAYWNFDGGAATDLTGNGNNGTLDGGAVITPIVGSDFVHAGVCGVRLPCTASASAVLSNDSVVGANILDGGCDYTNSPNIQIVGGGGSGAEAEAVVSNGMVVAVNVLDEGEGYTNAPLIVIDPPFIPNPIMGIVPMSLLDYSNLTVGGVYQMQQHVAWFWADQPLSFTATNNVYTQMVAGVVGSGDYRLALNPVPTQAFATPQVINGFVVAAKLTIGGSGYVTSPAVAIVGGGGSNATALSQISGGAVTNISITSAGIGYTNAPTVEIAQPPAAAVTPTVLPMMRLDSSDLAPYDDYQIQFTPTTGGGWENWGGGLFSPTDVTNSQFIFITNGMGFFRLKYIP